MFGKNKQVRADGATVTDTKRSTKVKYPNGDLEMTNKRTGRTAEFSRIRPDGKRERDGK